MPTEPTTDYLEVTLKERRKGGLRSCSVLFEAQRLCSGGFVCSIRLLNPAFLRVKYRKAGRREFLPAGSLWTPQLLIFETLAAWGPFGP